MDEETLMYATFGAYVAGLMDGYLSDNDGSPEAVIALILVGSKKVGLELRGM